MMEVGVPGLSEEIDQIIIVHGDNKNNINCNYLNVKIK